MELSKTYTYVCKKKFHLGAGYLLAVCIIQALFFSTTYASASTLCSDIFSHENRRSEWIDPEKTTALIAARDAGFEIKTIKGNVDGRPVEVTFLGERHINSEEQLALGAKARSFFKARGLEGVQAKAYWFPHLVDYAMKLVSRLYDRTAEDQQLQGSNVLESRREELLADLSQKLKGEPEDDRRAILKVLNEVGIEMPDGALIPLTDFLDLPAQKQLLMELVGNFEAPLIVNIPLETLDFGHKPTWKEQILALQTSLSLITALRGGAKLSTAAVVVGCGMAVCSASLREMGTLLGGAGAVGLAYSASALPSAVAFRMQSNVFMIKNLISGLRRHSDLDSILITVGSAHVSGMSAILKRDYGFTEIHL